MAIAGIDDPALRRAFIEETEDLHAKMGQALMALERDNANAEVMNEAFRCVHSIKSESALMGFEKLSALAHSMEDVLDRVRSGALPLDRAVMDLEFAGFDRVGEMLAAIGAGDTDGATATDDVLRGLSEAAARAGGAAAAPVAQSSGMAASTTLGASTTLERPRRPCSTSSSAASSRRHATGARPSTFFGCVSPKGSR